MSLIAQGELLTRRLEYFRNHSSNHIFNDARGLYLSGVLLGQRALRRFAEIIIRRELPLLISEDGFLMEGSSHYQFLFTRWALEIQWFSKICGDSELERFLVPINNQLIKSCRFFIVKNNDQNLHLDPSAYNNCFYKI